MSEGNGAIAAKVTSITTPEASCVACGMNWAKSKDGAGFLLLPLISQHNANDKTELPLCFACWESWRVSPEHRVCALGNFKTHAADWLRRTKLELANGTTSAGSKNVFIAA